MIEEQPIKFSITLHHPKFPIRRQAHVTVLFMPDGSILLDGFDWLTVKEYTKLNKMKPLEPDES